MPGCSSAYPKTRVASQITFTIRGTPPLALYTIAAASAGNVGASPSAACASR